MTIKSPHKIQAIKLINLCFISLLLTSCLTSEVPPLDASIPKHWRQQDQLTAATQTERNEQWWKPLEDPLLNQIIETAQNQNLTLQQASERIIFARAVQKQELASEKPQFNLYAGPNNLARALASNGTGVGQANQPQYVSSGAYLAGFDLLWELPIFGQGPGQRQVTQADLQISQADLSLKKISLTSEIVRVYAELLAAVERNKQLELTEEDYTNWKTLITKGVDQGMIAPDEVDALTEGIKATQRLKRQNLIIQESALQRLAVLSGFSEPQENWLKVLKARNENALLDAQENLSLPSALPADIIRQRPDIKIAESQVLKATGALGIAKSDLYPKLSIEGALMTTGRVTAERSSHTGSITYIAPSIRIPILDWGLRRQAVNQRESQLREALLAYKEAVLLAIEETENAIVTFNQSRDQLIDDNSELKRLNKKLIKLNNALETGYSSKLDIFKQAIKNKQASLQYIDAKLAWMRSYAYANKALSGSANLTSEVSN